MKLLGRTRGDEPRTPPATPEIGGHDVTPAEWSSLAERAGNVFGTWEWATAWTRHLSGAGGAHVLCVRGPDRELEALVPLWLRRTRGLRLVRFIGHGVSDHLGPVCPAGGEVAAGRLLTGALAELRPGWDVLLAENLTASAAPWAGVLAGHTLRREPVSSVPVADLSWDEFAARHHGRLRRLRNYARRLSRGHSVRYRLSDVPERLEADLDLLFALHAMRWGPGSRGLGPALRPFHREFAALALERGWLRLWFLEVDEAPVAAWYGFRFAGAEWAYQGGRDPAWESASVGSQILVHTLREAFQDGVRDYKMLRGAEAYKLHFAPVRDEVVTVIKGRGPRGRAAAGLATAAAEHRVVARALRAGVGPSRWRALGGAR